MTVTALATDNGGVTGNFAITVVGTNAAVGQRQAGATVGLQDFVLLLSPGELSIGCNETKSYQVAVAGKSVCSNYPNRVVIGACSPASPGCPAKEVQ